MFGRKMNYHVVNVSGVRSADGRKVRRRKTSRKRSRARKNGLALRNGLALTNPSFGNLGGWFTGYALPIVVAGAAAGGIHAFANFGRFGP